MGNGTRSHKRKMNWFGRFVKPTIFVLIIVTLIFTGLEFALLVAGVQSISSTEDPLVGFAGNSPLYVKAPDNDGKAMLKTADNKLRLFNHQLFSKQKDKTSYRIFCLGGSTTFGRPYTDEASFCGWLRSFLQAADPSRRWEVINAGGVSYASYRVARLMNELVQYQPDLFIVYTGQNEFLEQRSYGRLKAMPQWLLATDMALSRTRTYAALKKGIDVLQADTQAQTAVELSDEVDEVLRYTAGPTTYQRNDVLKQQILTHYRINLGRMVNIAREADADIIFVKPVVNLKDMSPFKSANKADLGESAMRQWEQLSQGAKHQQEIGNKSEALALYQQALQIDDRFADSHYQIGKLQFAMGNYAAAEKAYWRAVDEDIAPLRMLSSMPGIISEVADWHDVPMVDYEQILRAAYLENYDHAVFGNEFFLDHVHPNVEAYRLLALKLLDQLIGEGILTPAHTWGDQHIEELTNNVLAGLSKRDHGAALVRLGKVLDWAGKFDEAHNLFLKSMELVGPNGYAFKMLGKTAARRGQPDEAIKYYRLALGIVPDIPDVDRALAELLIKKGDAVAAIKHLRKDLALDDSNYDSHDRLALLLDSQGDMEAASFHFNEALRINPEYGPSMLNYMVLLAKQEKYAQAEALGHRLLSIASNNALAHNNLGIIMIKQGKIERAIDHFSEALRINPDLKGARGNLRDARTLQAHQ